MLEKKDWTVMIYMAGDNNLSVDMAYALEELQKKVVVNEDDNINLFVHYENNSPEIPALYCDFSDLENPVYQYSTDIQHKFSVNNETNFAKNKAVIPVIDFVDWCQSKSFGAENHALIFSGHTMGFLSMGLLKDESKDFSMSLPSLQEGLELIADKIIGKKLALLGFDSCVMSMFEVGQQFKNVAETMIASEGSIPNAGWSYAEILGAMASSNDDVKSIAGEFVQKYIEKQSKYSIGGVSVDMSAWDLSKIDNLNSKFGRLAQNLLKCFEDESSIIYKQMRRVLLQVHFNSQSYMFEQSIDLGDFCSLLIEEIASLKDETGQELNIILQNISECSKSVLREIYNCVILSGFSGGAYQFSTGISLFFPWSLSAYDVSANDYVELSFVAKTKTGKLWNQFLQKYLIEVSRRNSKSTVIESSSEYNLLETSTSQMTGFAHKIPLNPISKNPPNPVSKLPIQPLSRVPYNPLARVPYNPLARVPYNPLARVPYNPLARVPYNSVGKLPIQPLSRVPIQPLSKLPIQPLSRVPIQPLSKLPIQPLSRVPIQPLSRVPIQPLSKLPIQPLSRVSIQPLSKLPIQPLSRVPIQPLSKLPIQPLSRVPIQPLSKMTGISNQFVENFTKFKNIETRWDIMGYTKNSKKSS